MLIPRPTQRLMGFVLASLCLHLALLIARPAAMPRIAGQIETILSVTLTTPPETAAVTATRTHDVPIARPAAAEPIVANDNNAAAAEGGTAVDTDPGTADTDRPAHVRAQIQARLLTDLQRHFDYPLLARRRGWEGTVWLAFSIAPNGALEHIHVARGSGYDALDHSALTALRRVERLSEARAWLGGRPLDMQVPVIYRLLEH